MSPNVRLINNIFRFQGRFYVDDLHLLKILTSRGVLSLSSLVPILSAHMRFKSCFKVACVLEYLNNNLSNLGETVEVLD